VAARLIAFLAAMLVAVGCAGPVTEEPQPPAATPHTGVTPAIDAARAAVAAKLQPSGFTLTQALGYEPGAPPSVQSIPRVVYQLNLTGPNEGWVVIYDVGTSDGALAAGADFAEYLRRSGHSNYPADAEFTVNAIDSALVFHWWSAQRSTEPDRAAQAFGIISSVGQQIDVIN
jgi:hypothetical protein